MSPSYVMSTDFRPIAESRFRKPCGTESYKTWYLLLRSFTQPSFSGWNPLNLVFQGANTYCAVFSRFGIFRLYNYAEAAFPPIGKTEGLHAEIR
ncbi:MAG: hypothetical protein F6K58_00565 [Symploca sp. SIO2E9]|nr:hypothetical protein [Symploca sp. SIO2E9]